MNTYLYLIPKLKLAFVFHSIFGNEKRKHSSARGENKEKNTKLNYANLYLNWYKKASYL